MQAWENGKSLFCVKSNFRRRKSLETWGFVCAVRLHLAIGETFEKEKRDKREEPGTLQNRNGVWCL